ncbi:IS30 family transposase, partial [Streptomyces sp. 35M1]
MNGVTTPPVGLSALDKQLHPRFLTLAEREKIRDLRAAGQSLRAIGRVLGRPASTVKREIDANSGSEGYQPYAAHRAAAARRPRPKERKLLREGRLRRFVKDGLRRRWSPEQICHALRKECPDDESMRVSVETVYQALYFQARGGLKREVQAAIRSGRTRRKARRDPQRRTARFIDPMVMISDRPAAVEDRAVPGHWEGDLIIGAGGRSAIATLVERSTRYTMLVHLPGGAHDAETVRDGLVATVQTLPAHLRGSLTWDQGSEMARHQQFSMATGMPVYFCDPASPWQRGSNENTNGLLRQYFPKGTDL